jgi:hypothetical protein
VAKLPINPSMASLADNGQIEFFEGDWLDGMAEVVESL